MWIIDRHTFKTCGNYSLVKNNKYLATAFKSVKITNFSHVTVPQALQELLWRATPQWKVIHELPWERSIYQELGVKFCNMEDLQVAVSR